MKKLIHNKIKVFTAPRMHAIWAAFVLAACGGSKNSEDSDDTSLPPTTPTIPTSGGAAGRVIDGYIENARVFRDENSNKLFDIGENFVVSDSRGIFSGLTEASTATIVVDNHAGTARDTVTGFPLSFTMAAPSGYEVITPVTTLVVGLMERGKSKSDAETAVKSVLGLADEYELAEFDPFENLNNANASSSERELAESYQVSSMKIANLMLIRDGDYTNTMDRNFQEFLNKFSAVIESKHESGNQFDFSNVSDLRTVVNLISNKQVVELANENSAASYEELLDGQLLNVSGSDNGAIDVAAGATEQLIAIAIDGNYSASDEYSLTIVGVDGSVSSSEIVAVGKSVALFRFTKEQIDTLGMGPISVTVKNITNDESISSETTIDTIQPLTTSGGGGVGDTPAVVVSDDGIVADGYISGARVFRDENENETFDLGEVFVITDSSGAFTGLGGSGDKPIVADGNGGTAVDTSTGVTFNSVLSAPAGSKVVNPITTVVNELMQDSDPATRASITNSDGEIDVKLASDKVAQAFGLTTSSSFAVDLTKFDPIANKVYVEPGEVAPTISNNLATVTQGVATFIANLVVSGANEKGGTADNISSSTKSIFSNLKDVVKTKAGSGQAFKFDDQNDILSALGSDFSASSPSLEKLKTSFTGFDPSKPDVTVATGNFGSDKLLEKQLLSQSEFGDGVLTTSEASNGANLVVGPTSSPQTLDATAKITNEDTNISIFKQVKFSNAKYASIELSSAELTKLGGGTISVEVKNTANLTSADWTTTSASRIYDNFSSKAYFHKGITPVLKFGDKIFKTVSNDQVKLNNGDTSSLQIKGTVEIDLGAASLPTGVQLKNLVGGLGSVDDSTGRTVVIEVLDSNSKLVFLVNGKVTPETGATNANANSAKKGTFNWSASVDGTDKSVHDDTVTFASLNDGTYTVRLSFTDAYGTVSSDTGATFTNLIIDRSLPDLSISASDTSVNIVDQSTTFTVTFSKPIASTDIDYDLIKFSDSNLSSDKTLTSAISDGTATASFKAATGSDSASLAVTYKPTTGKQGTVDLKVLTNAITDGSGNKNGADKTTASTVNSVSYDLIAPQLPQADIKLYAASDSGKTSVLKVFDDNRSALKVDFTFSEPVKNFTLDDVTVGTVGGKGALTLSKLTPSSGSSNLYTADVVGLDQAEGAFTISVGSGSYTDDNGNEGSAGTSASLTIDTRAPKPFQVALDAAALAKDNSTKIVDKTTYEKGDVLVINVVFDQALNSTVDTASGTRIPTILLTIGGDSRNATLHSVSGSTAKFKYTVTNSDNGAGSGIGVGSVIVLTDGSGNIILESGSPKLADNILAADDGNGTNDENKASVDIGSVSQPINLSNKRVDGGDSGATVDGYIDGGIIYADNDGSSSLTAGDAIAQADATGGFTIYGANGPLVLENGFDISTNKEFAVRYKAPHESGSDGYQVINPITTLVAAKLAKEKASDNSYTLSSAEDYVHAEIGDPLASDSALRSYNAYEEIAKSIDASNVTTDTVKITVNNALAYQKAAASAALVVDFVATAAFNARADGVNTSIKDVSDAVFEAITARLDPFMGTFVGNNSLVDFYGTTGSKDLIATANDAFWEATDGTIYTELATILNTVTSNMDTKLGTTFGGVTNLLSDFPDTLELLSASIVAINLAKSDYSYPSTASTDADKLIAAAEAGITGLTEIVQVQSVVQADILGDISTYYINGKNISDKPTSVNVSGLLGTNEATGYLGQSVGTVVPIRYDIALDANTPPTQFESDNNGVASEFKFVVTRAGSIKTTSSLEYAIEGNISASDIAGGQMAGELVFDVNEKSKIINVRLNNDTIREADETITVVISDPTETSQIVNERASATVRDDDPSTPEISVGRSRYETTEDAKVILDDAFVDYFDLEADFKLEWDVGLGAISTTKSDGTAYTSGSSYVSYFELQTGLLRNLEYTASGQTTSSISDLATITISAVDDKDNIGRSASKDFEITFDVNRTPSIEIGSGLTFDSDTSFAGVATKISGITISDVDSGFVSVSVSADLDGQIATASTANYTQLRNSDNEITFSGDIASVQDALDQLTFKASKAGNVKLTLKIDDGDSTHARNADGTLAATATNSKVSVTETSAHTINASAPVLTQTFEPNLKVGANFWNAFTGISASDLDTANLTLTLSSPDSNARFRLYDADNVSAPILADAAASLVLSGTSADINQKLGYLQVELTANKDGSIKAVLSDADGSTTDPQPLLNYVAMDNAVPDPGGDRAITSPISEDGGSQAISVSDIRLFDSDAFVDGALIAPSNIKVLGSTGGTVTQVGGDSINDPSNGTPIAIPVSNGVLNLEFTPNANFFGDGIIRYVVIDPQQPTFTSSVSQITVNVAGVNDKPSIQLSSAPIVYTQDQAAVNLFNNVNVSDIDNQLGYIEIIIKSNNAQASDNILMPSEVFSVKPSSVGDTVTFSGTKTDGTPVYLSASEVSALLASIKFENPDNFFSSTQRSFDASVKDDGGLESDVATAQLTLRDINDAPSVTGGASIEAFTEGDTGVTFDKFGSFEDPEGNNIQKVSVSFSSGYSQGLDKLSYAGSSVSADFDEATGTLALTAVDPEVGLSASQFSAVLADVNYLNASENPKILSKKFIISATDVAGATGNSGVKEVTVVPVNDAPSVTSVTAGVESTTSLGGQFVKGGSPVKVAPNLRLKDPDSTEFTSAKVEVEASDTSPNSSLSLSNLGSSLVSIYGLNVSFNSNKTTVDISKASGTMPRDVLESLLREVQYENSGSELTGKTENIKVSASDSSGAASNLFTSEINLVDIPPIEVRDVSGFDSSSDYYITTQSTNPVKELKINVDTVPDPNDANATVNVRVFAATQFTVDLSSSSIRTEAGRFVYDRTKTNYTSNKLSDARHIDVSELDGASSTTSTTLLGSESANTIKGSDYADFIDGIGGRDVVRAGAGDDTVIIRMGQSDANSVYDGGSGTNDTLILPNLAWNGSSNVIFSGTVDLGDTSNLTTSYNVTVSNFENIDGRSATGKLNLSGSADSNILMGGNASDIIWIGAGGDKAVGGNIGSNKVIKKYTATDGQTDFAAVYDVGSIEVYVDGTRLAPSAYTATTGTGITLSSGASSGSKVEIIPIDDVFVFDLSSAPTSGSSIVDLSKDDRIKLSLDGSNYLAYDKVNWLHKSVDITAAKSDTFDVTKLDAWIESDTDGYKLVVETAQDVFKYLDIGTELYGTKGKWALNDDGIFVLKPTLNVAPKFKTLGPTSSESNPIKLTKSTGETVFSKALTSGDLISINEPADGDDGDPLTLTFKNVSGLTLKSGSNVISQDQVFSAKTPAEINTILAGLSVEMGSRGSGNLTFTIADDYAPEISKTLYFEAPNTAPTVSTNLDTNSPPEAEISTGQSLAAASLAVTIGDIDVADVDGKLLTSTIKVTGGSASVASIYDKYATINGGTITIKYDGSSDLGVKTWAETLEDIVEAISFTRETVGSVTAKLSVSDGVGATTNAASDLKFTFTAKDLAAPDIIAPSITANDTNPELNAAQFATGKARVFVKDVGAQPNDVVVFKTKVDGVDQPDFEVNIPSSATDPLSVTSFIEASLSDLVPSNVTGGAFSVSAVLKVGGSEISPKNTVTPSIFSLDTTPPSAPQIKTISDSTGTIGVVTNKEVSTILVSDPGKDSGNLSHALVKLNSVSELDWYNFSKTFDIKSLLQGDGFYLNEIAVTSTKVVNVDTSVDYQLSVDGALTDGIYAAIARDSVKNTSAWDVSSFNLNTLTPEIFVVDRELDGSDIGFRLLNAGSAPGDNYELFIISAEQSKAIEFAILPKTLGGSLPVDISDIKIEIWPGAISGTADIEAEFTRDFGASSNHWSKASGKTNAPHFKVSSKSAENAPVFELDLANGLTAASEQIGVVITVADKAGNTAVINVPSDQIQLDATADVDGPEGLVRSTISEEFFTGISAVEKSNFSAKVEGLDNDISVRTSYLLTDGQFASNLKLAKDAAPQSATATDGQTEFIFEKFDASNAELKLDGTALTNSDYSIAADGKTVTLNSAATADQVLSIVAKAGGQYFGDFTKLTADSTAFFETDGSAHQQFESGSVYLDISDAFLASLHLSGDTTTKAPSTGMGSQFSDWILVGTSSGKAQYITFEDYLSFEPGTTDLGTLNVYLSEYVVHTAHDDFGRPALETIEGVDLSPIFPSLNADDNLVLLTEVSDVAGNVAFGSNIFNQNSLSSTNPAAVLLLDNTPPKAPAVLIERSNNGLDFWEAQQTLKATISPTGTGDVLEISSVKFNGVNVDYNADQKFFTFDVPKSLSGGSSYDLTANFTDSSGNEKVYATSVDLTRDATAEFAVIPTVTKSADVHTVVFDIYINTELTKFSSASSIDLHVVPPSTQFEYVSAAKGPGLENLQFVINDTNPDKIYFSAIAQDTFNAGVGVTDEPLFSVTMKHKAAIYDAAVINDSLKLKSILVDEQQVSDFNYTLDFTDLIVSSAEI